MNNVTIKVTCPEVMETRAFTRAKGASDRVETARVIRHEPGKWHESVVAAVWTKGVQRYANDYFASESDPEAKAFKIAEMVAGFNGGRPLVDVTGKAQRASAKVSDPATVRARQLARKVLKAEMTPAEYKAAYTDADAADQLAALDAWLDDDKRGEKVRKRAARQIRDEAELAGI